MVRNAAIAFGLGVSIIATVAGVHSQSINDGKVVELTGVNIAGAEFAANVIPGRLGKDYIFPSLVSMKYYASKGMNVIRVPVLWERLQHDLHSELDVVDTRHLDAVIRYAAFNRMKVVIDVHNYASYANAVIGSEKVPVTALGDLWRRLSLRYRDNDAVIFGLMNEPTKLPTETWLAAANYAIAEIRKTGARNLILVPGNGWSAARDWNATKYGTPNSKVMLNVVDPGKRYAFDVHQFFDRDFTGTHDDCASPDAAVEMLKPFTQWARSNGRRGFLGEFGVSTNPVCLMLLDRLLRFMAVNNDVWHGWTYWAGGAWWAKDYYTNVEPLEGKDRPQMAVLEKYLNHPLSARGN